MNKIFFSFAFSTFFGLGYCPIAPGTVASIAASLIYLISPRWILDFTNPNGILFFASIFFLGKITSDYVANNFKKKDPSIVVIDEVFGMLLALSLFSCLKGKIFSQSDLQIKDILLTLTVFRLFDILKPFPINKFETFPGGLGIMLDDVAAGFLSTVASIFILKIKFISAVSSVNCNLN